VALELNFELSQGQNGIFSIFKSVFYVLSFGTDLLWNKEIARQKV
jgi:hypothetical protein